MPWGIRYTGLSAPGDLRWEDIERFSPSPWVRPSLVRIYLTQRYREAHPSLLRSASRLLGSGDVAMPMISGWIASDLATALNEEDASIVLVAYVVSDLRALDWTLDLFFPRDIVYLRPLHSASGAEAIAGMETIRLPEERVLAAK